MIAVTLTDVHTVLTCGHPDGSTHSSDLRAPWRKYTQFWLVRCKVFSRCHQNFLSKPQLKCLIFITARIRRMGKALFSQVSVCPQGDGTSVPGSFLSLWCQVLWRGRGIPRRPGLGYTPSETEQQSEYLLDLRGGKYASCGHAGGLSYWQVKTLLLPTTCLNGDELRQFILLQTVDLVIQLQRWVGQLH